MLGTALTDSTRPLSVTLAGRQMHASQCLVVTARLAEERAVRAARESTGLLEAGVACTSATLDRSRTRGMDDPGLQKDLVPEKHRVRSRR